MSDIKVFKVTLRLWENQLEVRNFVHFLRIKEHARWILLLPVKLN